MPELEITYFDSKGRAEAARLALTIAGIPFKDTRIGKTDFPALKASGKLPFGALPILTVDGDVLSQSKAISTYVATLGGLYPTSDHLLAARIDEFIFGIDDATAGAFKGNDEAARGAWTKNDVPRFVGGLENIAKKNTKSKTWVCGPNLSLADINLYCMFTVVKEGILDHVPKDLVDAYPRLISSYNAVSAHPKVVEWNKTHPWDPTR